MAPAAVLPPIPPTTLWDDPKNGNIPLILEKVNGLVQSNGTNIRDDTLQELLSENILAKLLRVAVRDLKDNNPPIAYPEYVPQNEALGPVGRYHLREADFWTCGFFPGTLYSLLERSTRYPKRLPKNINRQTLEAELIFVCHAWSESLHSMAFRTDTHDLGFIIEPALRLDWELFGNTRSLQSIITAAHSLASRYEDRAQAIRSWDLINKKDIQVISMKENFIVIIDSLCNLDLLYYAAKHSGDSSLADIATRHAKTLLTSHLRPESVSSFSNKGYQGQLYSTCHVTNIDPRTGAIKMQLTAQGYDDSSTWARGQAWAILGYAQTYGWTQDPTFLDASMGCAEYFLHRLEKQQEINQSYKIPLWDFDGPIFEDQPVWDSSAGTIAANGMLIISDALESRGQGVLARRFRDAAVELVEKILEWSLSEEKARFVWRSDGKSYEIEDVKEAQSFDSVLKNATANNNAGARKRYSNHGLVYGDYYLVQFGNRLLDMGLI